MESLVNLAFKDLVSRFDEITVVEPNSVKDLLDIYREIRILFSDFENLLHHIERATSIDED